MPDDPLSDPAIQREYDGYLDSLPLPEPTPEELRSPHGKPPAAKKDKLSSMAEIPAHVKAKADAAMANVKQDIKPLPKEANSPAPESKNVDDWRNMKHQERATERMKEKEKQTPDKG